MGVSFFFFFLALLGRFQLGGDLRRVTFPVCICIYIRTLASWQQLAKPEHQSRTGGLIMEKSDLVVCESGTPLTPRKTFKSVSSYACYEVVRVRAFYIWLLWLVVLSISPFVLFDLAESEDWVCEVYWQVLMLNIVLFFPAMLFYRSDRQARLVSQNLTNFMSIVENTFESGHGIGPEKWDEVACKMNREFYDAGIWKTPYSFFDGLEVEKLYRSLVLNPQLGKNLDVLDVCEKGPKETTAYEKRLDEQFSVWANDSEYSAEECGNMLPRDLHWNEVTWTIHKMRLALALHIAVSLIFHSMGLFGVLCGCLITTYIEMQTPYVLKDTRMSTTNRLRLLATIVSVAPGTDVDRWDVIAKRVNSYLHEIPECPASDCFFDGKSCLDCFERYFKPPTSQKKKRTFITSNELKPFVSRAIEACS